MEPSAWRYVLLSSLGFSACILFFFFSEPPGNLYSNLIGLALSVAVLLNLHMCHKKRKYGLAVL